MKKNLLIVLVLIILALVIGWYLVKSRNTAPVSVMETGKDIVNTNEAPPSAGGASGVIGSIKDAMGLGKKMKCAYSGKDGGTTSTVFVDGQKFKFVSEMNGEKLYGLFDGETQYTWTAGAQKQGWKMTKSCMDELGTLSARETQSAGNDTAPQDYQKSFDAAQNVRCEAAAGEDFSVPADIVFADQCAMLKNSMKSLQNIKGQLPSGVNIPGY